MPFAPVAPVPGLHFATGQIPQPGPVVDLARCELRAHFVVLTLRLLTGKNSARFGTVPPCATTVRALVTPPDGSEVKAGTNWKHIVWTLQQTEMPRKQADAVVRRLLSDRRLTARKYGRAYVLFERKAEGRTYGPSRILGAAGLAALRDTGSR